MTASYRETGRRTEELEQQSNDHLPDLHQEASEIPTPYERVDTCCSGRPIPGFGTILMFTFEQTHQMHNTINLKDSTLVELCKRYRIRRMSLFGSQLKGSARPDSDIDLLVEFFSDAKPTLFDMARIG